ncbi:hypothetical protein D3C78_794500 [compost metagenome]
MLLCKDRCRHKHGNLLAFNCRFKGGSNRNFCFTVSNIPAQETVHRTSLFHILLDFFDCPNLVPCLFIRKHIFKFLLLRRILLKGVARRCLPLSIQLDQIIRDILYRRTDFIFHTSPFITAELVYFRLLILRAHIFLNKINLLNRHRQLIAACIQNMHVILVDTAYL